MRERRRTGGRLLGYGLAVACLGLASAAGGSISEPDHLFYGLVTSGGTPLSDAAVFLRSDDCGGTDPANELARSGPGALAEAPDFYVLAVRVETLTPDDPGPTPGVARAGDMGTVCVTWSDAVTQEVSTVAAGKLYVGGRGLAVRFDLDVAADGSTTADTDGDGIPDFADNCAGIANAAQADADGNGIGDLCDCRDVAQGEPCLNPAAAFALLEQTGNPADTTTGLGSVAYVFEIGGSEVTNAEYRDFLAAVASVDDLHGLYSAQMASDPRGGIARMGAPGAWSYAVKPAMADKPVNFVSWLDAARYANWLENQQPVGGQDASTTETGAFDLATPADPGREAVMDPGALWSLATEDEWFKAAHYDPALGAYRLYPTGSDADPALALADALGNVVNPGPNVANHESGAVWNGLVGNVTTTASAGAPSPYGTFDQGGNVGEWLAAPAEAGGLQTEGCAQSPCRLVRGGSFASDRIEMRSSFGAPGTADREGLLREPGFEGAEVGFRVVRLDGLDTDADGVADADDNCPDVANPDQTDRGGVGAGSPPDGVGDACQCGDVNANGLVTSADATILFNEARGNPTGQLRAPELADVNGNARCTTGDATILFNFLRGAQGVFVPERCFTADLTCP